MRFLLVYLAVFFFGCAHQQQLIPVHALPDKPISNNLKLNIPPDIQRILTQLGGEEVKKPEVLPEVCKGQKDGACVVEAALLTEVDEDSVKLVTQKLKAAEEAKAKAFLLEINSPGGSVPDGIVLSKAIERSKLSITCVVDGEADSMASFILQSCPVRIMTKRSLQMYHEPAMSSLFQGQPNQWAAMAARLEAMRVAMAEHCVKKMRISVADYRAKTDGSQMWWLTWEDSLKVGAVDKVVDNYTEVLNNL